jgi:hypothetical protein
MGRIYGQKNWTEVTQSDLHGSFNSWAKNKQFVIGSEITGSDSRSHADQLKHLITSDTLTINEKYIPQYELPNCANFFLNSNRANALYLEDADRRFFVWEVQQKAPHDFFTMFDGWYKVERSIAAIHHHLMHYDLTGFNPRGQALVTQAKAEMTAAARSAHATWAHALLESPEQYLCSGRVPWRSDLYTAKELLDLYKRTEDMNSKVSLNHMGETLVLAGALRLDQIRWKPAGSPVQRADRFYAVRNQEQWTRATPAQIRKHLESAKQQLG